MSDPQEQTLNLPSLVFVVILVGLSIRYFFFSPSSATDARSSNRGRAADPAHVDQILQMFPQLNRRDIQWDLQRNGGSVQATTERVLGGRGLERVSLPRCHHDGCGMLGGSREGFKHSCFQGRNHESSITSDMGFFLTTCPYYSLHPPSNQSNHHLPRPPPVPLLHHPNLPTRIS